MGRFSADAGDAEVGGFGGGGGLSVCDLGRLDGAAATNVNPPAFIELLFLLADEAAGGGGGGGFLTFLPINIARRRCCSKTSFSFCDDMMAFSSICTCFSKRKSINIEPYFLLSYFHMVAKIITTRLDSREEHNDQY